MADQHRLNDDPDDEPMLLEPDSGSLSLVLVLMLCWTLLCIPLGWCTLSAVGPVIPG